MWRPHLLLLLLVLLVLLQLLEHEQQGKVVPPLEVVGPQRPPVSFGGLEMAVPDFLHHPQVYKNTACGAVLSTRHASLVVLARRRTIFFGCWFIVMDQQFLFICLMLLALETKMLPLSKRNVTSFFSVRCGVVR